MSALTGASTILMLLRLIRLLYLGNDFSMLLSMGGFFNAVFNGWFEISLWVEAAKGDGGDEAGNADEDADDEDAQLDPVDLRRCAHPGKQEEVRKVGKKMISKPPGTPLHAVDTVLFQKAFQLSVVFRKDSLHLVQVHLLHFPGIFQWFEMILSHRIFLSENLETRTCPPKVQTAIVLNKCVLSRDLYFQEMS